MGDRILLFDIDGTLIETFGAGRRAMERAFSEVLGIEDAASRAEGVRYAGRTDPRILEDVARALGIDDERFRAATESLIGTFLVALEDELSRPDSRRRTLPGITELLPRLQSLRHVHLGLLTGNLEQGARIKLRHFGLERFFVAGGFSSDHPDRRRIAAIARRAVENRAGVRAPDERVIVIGDTEWDIDCARANGFRAVAIDSGWVPRERLTAAGPDAILSDFRDPEAVDRALGLAG